jgi:hypothetical protein
MYEPLVHTSEREMENHQQRQIQSFIGYCTIKERSLPFLVVHFPIHCDFSDKNNLTKQASALSLKRFHPISPGDFRGLADLCRCRCLLAL